MRGIVPRRIMASRHTGRIEAFHAQGAVRGKIAFADFSKNRRIREEVRAAEFAEGKMTRQNIPAE